jgi:hypothetical protein
MIRLPCRASSRAAVAQCDDRWSWSSREIRYTRLAFVATMQSGRAGMDDLPPDNT